MLIGENEIDCCLNSTTQTGEHTNISNVFVCVPFPVIFVVAIILLSFPPLRALSLVTTGNTRCNPLRQDQFNLSYSITMTESANS